jgi:oligopeptide transport system substrate-binding protein
VQACIPPDDIERLQDGDAYVRSPGLVTRFLGLNLKTVPDLNQRRALAFALDRTSLVENVTKAGEQPATSLTPEGVPGFDAIAQDFLPKVAEIEAARRYLDRASSPKRALSLYYSSTDPGARQTAVAVQAMWKQIGLRVELHGQEANHFYELVGPPTDPSIDVFVWGTLADYGDDIAFLEIFACGAGYNPNGYCDARYDRLIARARETPDNADRYQLYAQAEAMLTGANGVLPIIPTYWASLPTLRDPAVEGWQPNLLGRHDFTKVSVAHE